MSYNEEDYLLISGIQHYAFCPRQWGLIHIKNQWNENYLTASGRALHEKVHTNDNVEKRGNLIIFRGLKVFSKEYGLCGECDAVEFNKSDKGINLNGYEGLWLPYPVEYKRGKAKINDCDRLQLCAQAVCLEEMLSVTIETGAIFYGEPRRREIIIFSDELRNDLFNTIKSMHEAFSRKTITKVVKEKHCVSCSLKDICLPFLGNKVNLSVRAYLEEHIE